MAEIANRAREVVFGKLGWALIEAHNWLMGRFADTPEGEAAAERWHWIYSAGNRCYCMAYFGRWNTRGLR